LKYLSGLFLFSILAIAQPAQKLIFVTSDPAGSCTNGQAIRWNATSGNLFACKGGTWTNIATGSGGGPGTVTSVASGTGLTGGPITTTGTLSIVNPLNQNTSGTAANLSGTPTLPNGVTVTTQSQNDNSTKAASTAYTDLAVANAIAGVNPAIAVLAASTATLTGTYSNGVAGIGATFTVTATGTFTLDGVAINTIGQRVLLKNQTSGFQNGMYTATIVGAVAVSPVFTRVLDYDTPFDINSTGAIPVQSGTVNTTTSWLLTSSITTVGTDALTYVQFSVSPSAPITLTTTGTSGAATLSGATPPVLNIPQYSRGMTLCGTPNIGAVTGSIFLASAAPTMSYSSIPGSFNNLKLIIYGRSAVTGATDFPVINFNNDSTSGNYTQQQLTVQSTTVTGQLIASTTGLAITIPASSITSGFPGAGIIDIPFYSDSTLQKLAFMSNPYGQSGTPNLALAIEVGQWKSGSAINSVSVSLGANNFIIGSGTQLYCY
jgi:trimeric autotransporter adhesin